MGINILAELEGLITDGARFKGAIFLTYSLNLQFFEQLIQPKLDALGCTHVVIISDVFGYQEALSRNLHHITGVGRRYVCAPIHPNGHGVQHGKVLMLVSENRGWMLVGSGNLTFHGYGQNLELFDLIKYDETESNSSDVYPFQSTWRLIEQLQSRLSKTAQDQLTHIYKYATWLGRSLPASQNFALWNSFNQPLIEKIAALGTVNELLLIAPFVDLEAVQQLVEHLLPSKLIIGVNSLCPNLDGKSVEALCRSLGCDLEIRAIHALESQIKRGLHAKAIVGVHETGSWCIAGSANITRPALLDHWNAQGNLEIVVYRNTSNSNAFDLLSEDELLTSTRLSIRDMIVEVKEPVSTRHQEIISLSNVVARDGNILGQVYFREKLPIKEIRLHLILINAVLVVSLDDQNRFSVPLDITLAGSEAALIEVLCNDGITIHSAVVFVDQPYELDRYGARSFHRSMRGKLELVQDAAHTFKELMDFLFQRTDRDRLKHEDITQQKRAERRKRKGETHFDTEPEVLPINGFITDDELSYQIGRHIDVLNPYDRDHYSLRDLLSLALLRLTTETTSQRTLDASIDSEEDEQTIYVETENMRQTQRTWQEWLVNYLVSYCKRYHHRLLDTEFLLSTGHFLLFQNHHTLCRVILEFHEKTEILTNSRLREIVRQIWSPFFGKDGVLDTYKDGAFDSNWMEESLSELFLIMVATAWSDTIPQSLSDISSIKRFLYIKRLIARAESYLGNQFWHSNGTSVNDPNGLEILNSSWNQISIDIIHRFDDLANFKTPSEKRYEPCIRLLRLKKSGEMHSPEATQLVSYLQQNEPKLLGLIKNASRVATVVGDRRECPGSFIELPEFHLMQLRRGELIESPHTHGLLLYWVPDVDEEHIVL